MKKLDEKTLKYIAQAYGSKPQRYAGNESNPSASEVENLTDADSTPLPDASIDDTNADQGPSAPQLVADATPTQPPSGFDGSPEANPNVPVPADTTAAAPEQSDYQKAGVPDIEGALQEEKSANTAMANAESNAAQLTTKALSDFNQAEAALPTSNDIVNQFKAKDDALQAAYQSKTIDPNRFYNNLSTGQKVTAGIALALGGFAGLAHQGNPVLGMMDNAIQRDIMAQKAAQDQQMNLWTMNRQALGNDLAANLQTENQLLQGVKYQVGEATSKAAGPIAQAQALQLNAPIDQRIAENRFKLSLMQPTSDSFGIDPAKKVSWLVPAAQQAKVFDEIEAAQNATHNAPAILSAFDEAAKESRPLTGGITGSSGAALLPGVDTAHQKQMHALLGPTFKDVEGTVRQAAMDNMFKNSTPQFGDSDSTVNAKRDALIGYLTSKSAATAASGFGINLDQYPSTNVKAALPQPPGTKTKASQNPSSQGPEIRVTPDGRKWIQGANGKAIPYQGKP